jgi:hypothetical protein
MQKHSRGKPRDSSSRNQPREKKPKRQETTLPVQSHNGEWPDSRHPTATETHATANHRPPIDETSPTTATTSPTTADPTSSKPRLPQGRLTTATQNHNGDQMESPAKNPACNGYTTANGLITADPTSELLRLITCLREATRATPTITTHATTATTSPTTADPTSTKPHRMLTIDARGSTYTSVGGSRAEPPVFSKLASHQATFVAARDSMPRRSAKQTSRPP